MKVYNSIQTQIKPLVRDAQLHYVESFDIDSGLNLRGRRFATFPEMLKDAIKVEGNLMAYEKIKYKFDTEKKKAKEESQPSTSQSADAKFNLMMRNMERIVYIISFKNRPASIE